MLSLSTSLNSALVEDHQEQCAGGYGQHGRGLSSLRNQVGWALVEAGLRIAVRDRMGRTIGVSGGRHHG